MEESYNVCQNCGTKKGVGKSFCEGCGAIRQVGTAFCQECGFKFDDSIADAAPAASVPVSQQTQAQQMQSVASMDNSQYLPPKKFCRNCGKQVMNNQVICTACGVKVGDGQAYCPHCGATVANPEQIACTSCGMSLKKGFDFNAAAAGVGDAIGNVFKGNPKDVIIDYGANFISLLTFVLCFVPAVYIYVSVYGISETEKMNVFGSNGFAGFLFIMALVVSIIKFIPPVDNFLKNIPVVKDYIVFGAPGLMILGLVFLIISVIRGAAEATAYSGLVNASCGFTFGGWMLVICVLLATGLSVLSFLRKKGIVHI